MQRHCISILVVFCFTCSAVKAQISAAAMAVSQVELGKRCYGRGEMDLAIDHYNAVLSADPNYADACFHRGNALYVS